MLMKKDQNNKDNKKPLNQILKLLYNTEKCIRPSTIINMN